MSQVLVVLATWPWPVRSGDGRRAVAVLDALRAGGHEVEVCCLVEDPALIDRAAADPSAEPIPMVRRRLGWWARARWLLSGSGPPLSLLSRDPAVARATIRARLEATDPDLVWCGRLDAWWVVAPVLGDRAVVVDTVDLESRKERARLRMLRVGDRVGSWRAAAARFQGGRTVRAWTALEQRAAARATVAVCSPDEAACLPGAVVIPNSYPTPPVPAGRPAIRCSRTVLLAGLLTYPPNADGARWLLDQVLPRLRAEVPDVHVRLVGRNDASLRRRHEPPHVCVVGFVDELDAELAQADVVVVPVRYGGGTRIKVLEAWAHGIPVVATQAGIEGLGAEPGRDALVTDDPQAFAAACARVLTDPGLRRSLAAGGLARHEAAFTEHHLRAAVDAAVSTAIGDGRRRC